MLSRPDSTEYAEFYKNYIARVPEGKRLDFLARRPTRRVPPASAGTPDAAAQAEPAPGKSSIKQVLGHICDTERVISYRALRFARGDGKELAGFEQDDYVREADSNARSLDDLLNEFESVRKSTVALFASLPAGSDQRGGTATVVRQRFAPSPTSPEATPSIITTC